MEWICCTYLVIVWENLFMISVHNLSLHWKLANWPREPIQQNTDAIWMWMCDTKRMLSRIVQDRIWWRPEIAHLITSDVKARFQTLNSYIKSKQVMNLRFVLILSERIIIACWLMHAAWFELNTVTQSNGSTWHQPRDGIIVSDFNTTCGFEAIWSCKQSAR